MQAHLARKKSLVGGIVWVADGLIKKQQRKVGSAGDEDVGDFVRRTAGSVSFYFFGDKPLNALTLSRMPVGFRMHVLEAKNSKRKHLS